MQKEILGHVLMAAASGSKKDVMIQLEKGKTVLLPITTMPMRDEKSALAITKMVKHVVRWEFRFNPKEPVSKERCGDVVAMDVLSIGIKDANSEKLTGISR